MPFDSEVIDGHIGVIARFHDPDGHAFYLYQPSAEALSWPSGAKIASLAGQGESQEIRSAQAVL